MRKESPKTFEFYLKHLSSCRRVLSPVSCKKNQLVSTFIKILGEGPLLTNLVYLSMYRDIKCVVCAKGCISATLVYDDTDVCASRCIRRRCLVLKRHSQSFETLSGPASHIKPCVTSALGKVNFELIKNLAAY